MKALVLVLVACSSSSPPAPADPNATLIKDLQAFTERLKHELGETIGVLEAAQGDCAKAAAGMIAIAPVRQETTKIGTELKAKVEASPELRAKAREIMAAAFPKELRDRADAVLDPIEAKCANDAAFRDAMTQSGYPKAH